MTTEPTEDMVTREMKASIVNGRLTISISVADLIHNARTGPGLEWMKFHLGAEIYIVDGDACAQSLLKAMQYSDDVQGAPFIGQLIDDAVELAIEKGLPGFVVTKQEAA